MNRAKHPISLSKATVLGLLGVGIGISIYALVLAANKALERFSIDLSTAKQ